MNLAVFSTKSRKVTTMPKILIYNDGDEYVGQLQDCEIIIIPDATPENVLEERRRGGDLTTSLTSNNIPYLHILGPHDHAVVKTRILEALRELPRKPKIEIDCSISLSEIERYEKK